MPMPSSDLCEHQDIGDAYTNTEAKYTKRKMNILFLLFKRLMFLLCIQYSVCVPEGQKRAPDIITDGFEPPCGCWEVNSGPLEEQPGLNL